jgi:hypothetical protein
MAPELHPKTEYDKGFYKPNTVFDSSQKNNSKNKDYLKATGMINV